MPDRVNSAVTQLERAMEERVVSRLADRYGFVAVDALKWLRDDRTAPSVPLPFCGVVEPSWCKGVRLNHGLHTQCIQPPGSGDLCRTCSGQAKRNKSGAPTYGRIEARFTHIRDGGEYSAWRDPSGKLAVPYSKVMEKLGISRAEAEGEARRLGWTIPEEHFAAAVRAVGRPRNSTAVSDTESDSGEAPVKRRGRPRKNKAVVTADQGDDLIAHLLTQAPKAPDTARPRKRKGRKPVMIVAPAQPTSDQDESGGDIAVSPPGDGGLSPAEEAVPAMEDVPKEVVPEEVVPKEVVPEEVVPVRRFNWSGVEYLRGPDDVLYDPETQNEVGLWSPARSCVIEIPGQVDFD